MPRVLHKLRVDEVSCVDCGAGDGTRVVLWKRHDPKPSIYHEIFARKDNVQKSAPRFRGVSGRKIHLLENLSRSEAKSFLLQDPSGRALLRDTGSSDIDALADHLVEASKRPTNKHQEAPKMNINKIDKTLREIGEAGFTKMIEKYAATVRQPGETKEQAFVRVFTADDDEGQALRKAWTVSKQGPVLVKPVANERDDEDEDENEDEDEHDDTDAMEELDALAEHERRRNPKLSKAQAFTKAYTDPENARLAQRERRQNRPRA